MNCEVAGMRTEGEQAKVWRGKGFLYISLASAKDSLVCAGAGLVLWALLSNPGHGYHMTGW